MNEINWLVLYGILVTLTLPILAFTSWQMKQTAREFFVMYGYCLIAFALMLFLGHLAVSWLDANGWTWLLILFGLFWLSCALIGGLLHALLGACR